jgi:hypothetical protein
MATIEPRLIHLLNESTTPQLAHADLPPLHSLPRPKSTELPPLAPIEHNHNSRGATAYFGGDDSSPLRRLDDERQDSRYAPSLTVYPLRLLLGEADTPEPSCPVGKILDDTPDLSDDASYKKRQRAAGGKDDFLQLPQPVKKQKATPQAPVMPPIINGLHEPPPHAALFPPISSSSFNENDAGQLRILQEFNHSDERLAKQPSPPSDKDRSAAKPRKRSVKPRRKWSEEETNHLLLGVSRHGVGKWTSILEDPDFTFNSRTAGDLKDRFRTCCPVELRGSSRDSAAEPATSSIRGSSFQRAKKGIHSENILIEDEGSPEAGGMMTPPTEPESVPKPKKTRAHRKKMEDLESLGIHAPFKKSLRRERRPFTEQDDRQILDGLDEYGPAWTKIQRDARFQLASRQPTDLRDRVRNKYPSIYQRIEKGTFQIKTGGRGNGTLEPSVTMSIENSFSTSKNAAAESHMNRTGSREDLPRFPLHLMDLMDTSTNPQNLDMGETTTSQFIGGEMDINRLLLDDSKPLQSS